MKTAVLRYPRRRMSFEPRERTHAADPALAARGIPAALCLAAGGAVVVVDHEFDPAKPDACEACARLVRLLDGAAIAPRCPASPTGDPHRWVAIRKGGAEGTWWICDGCGAEMTAPADPRTGCAPVLPASTTEDR